MDKETKNLITKRTMIIETIVEERIVVENIVEVKIGVKIVVSIEEATIEEDKETTIIKEKVIIGTMITKKEPMIIVDESKIPSRNKKMSVIIDDLL